jgi:hypothetical protein
MHAMSAYVDHCQSRDQKRIEIIAAMCFRRRSENELLPRPISPDEDSKYIGMLQGMTRGLVTREAFGEYERQINSRYRLELAEWPIMRSIIIVGDIPFSIESYKRVMSAGSDLNSRRYLLAWCSDRGELLVDRLCPAPDPVGAARDVLRIATERGYDQDEIQLLAAGLQRQLWELERIGASQSPADGRRQMRWNHLTGSYDR